MDGKQLKNSILQWAIQGKLVSQNPKDEPASKLLERIAESRNESSLSLPKGTAKGTKSKDLKKKTSKNQPSRIYCENGVWYEQIGTAAPKDISDEIPFEIPENWAWCRMGNIGSWGAGATPAKGNPAFYQNGEIPWLLTGELNNSIVSETKTKISKLALEKCSLRLCKPGDILIAMYGATIGKLAIAGIELTTNQACCACTVHYDFNKYLFYFLMASKSDLIKRGEGGAQPNISKEKLVNYLMPLPPLAEQKRIVAKLEQVLPLAEEYGAAQEQLDKLNKELPEALKKSILQEAIQGKLVPQNPKDEPAQKLLERITVARSESSQPKGAKSKRTTPTSRIYCENGTWYEQIGNAEPKDITDEIPFDIPTSWVWCRLGQCSDYGATKEKAKSFDGMKDSWSLDLEDIEKNSGRIVKRLKVCERKIVGEKVVFKKGQVLYSKLRPYLKKILVAPEDGVCSSEIVPFSPFEYLDADYLVTVLKSPHVDYTINLVTYGVKMPRVGTDTMLNLLIPLPPLAEQKRIVAKLEQLFKVL